MRFTMAPGQRAITFVIRSIAANVGSEIESWSGWNVPAKIAGA